MTQEYITLTSYRMKNINAYLVRQGLDHFHNNYGTPIDEENQERAYRNKRHTVKVKINNLEDGIYRYVEAGGSDFNKVVIRYLKIENGEIQQESNNLNDLIVSDNFDNLPELTGSEKQVNWAISIREKYLAKLSASKDSVPDWVQTQVSAKWFIENRNQL